jgi:hypothetical protein
LGKANASLNAAWVGPMGSCLNILIFRRTLRS